MGELDVRLIAALRVATVHLPAGEFAAQLGAPLPVVRNRLAELQAAGFEIEERPGLGFRLLASPDRLIADDLHAHLGSCGLVREIVVFAETGSTNEVALSRGRQGAAGGLVVFAESQTAGRGRFGRPWISASHRGLWFSLLLRPGFPQALWPRLTTWAAVALAETIECELGLFPTIKWPNDVQIDGCKVAGILAESGTDLRGEPFAVVGMGVNVNHESTDFPPEIATLATSLRLAIGRPIDRPAFAAALLRTLSARLPQLTTDFPEFISEATRRSSLLGHWIRVRSGTTTLEGRATTLDADGHLHLLTAHGTEHRLPAGEVTILSGEQM